MPREPTGAESVPRKSGNELRERTGSGTVRESTGAEKAAAALPQFAILGTWRATRHFSGVAGVESKTQAGGVWKAGRTRGSSFRRGRYGAKCSEGAAHPEENSGCPEGEATRTDELNLGADREKRRDSKERAYGEERTPDGSATAGGHEDFNDKK